MALRRRTKRTERSKIDATPPWEVRKAPEISETFGPFDVTHAPDDDVTRLDFGALRVAPGELELQLQVGEDRRPVSVLLTDGSGSMELLFFAAPRSAGIWDELRPEIVESVVEQGGSLAEESGEFGPELAGKMPAPTGFAPVRFLGIDGPRWFLRALLAGAPATDPARAVPFLEALRATVVVRGSEPLPVREVVPLTLPPDLAAQLNV